MCVVCVCVLGEGGWEDRRCDRLALARKSTSPHTLINVQLYLYGGVFEDGDREYCLDDAWCLDLNRREEWRCLLPGTMHLQVWKGDDDDTEMGDGDSSDEDEDSADEGSGSEEESGSSSESGSSGSESDGGSSSGSDGGKKKKKKKKKDKKKGKEGKGKGKGKGHKTLKEEIAELQASLAIDDADRTPQVRVCVAGGCRGIGRRVWGCSASGDASKPQPAITRSIDRSVHNPNTKPTQKKHAHKHTQKKIQLGEALRDFFARTTEFWTRRAVEEVDRRAAERYIVGF